ncbi:unnamed protein product [Rangifer tarandus platyrhynchus]|uniref:Uncharacterized protein n=2 Tax=Rangifer tarandus platyrhynchus TaxID=3082113 RepID=A0ABN8Y3E1_RANTA|nr:unnamed protein product [Rangifer tarandus platyrhynchus]CAI9692718.1 unnamed protein product [Rangifer tarandus platyrhynchus]
MRSPPPALTKSCRGQILGGRRLWEGSAVQSKLALACTQRVPEGSQRNAFASSGPPVDPSPAGSSRLGQGGAELIR